MAQRLWPHNPPLTASLIITRVHLSACYASGIDGTRRGDSRALCLYDARLVCGSC